MDNFDHVRHFSLCDLMNEYVGKHVQVCIFNVYPVQCFLSFYALERKSHKATLIKLQPEKHKNA